MSNKPDAGVERRLDGLNRIVLRNCVVYIRYGGSTETEVSHLDTGGGQATVVQVMHGFAPLDYRSSNRRQEGDMTARMDERGRDRNGGASGIGRAIAERLIAEGVRAALADRDDARARETAVEFGDDCLAVTCDVADQGSVGAMVEAVISPMGPARHSGQQCRHLSHYVACRGRQ